MACGEFVQGYLLNRMKHGFLVWVRCRDSAVLEFVTIAGHRLAIAMEY